MSKPKRQTIIVATREMEAVKAVLEAGKSHGYGNMMAWLGKAWGEKLMRDYRFSEKHATDLVSNRSPYPLGGRFPFAFRDIDFNP